MTDMKTTELIRFIEARGMAPAGNEAAYRDAVEQAGFDGDAREVLLRRDATALNALLGGRAAMWCAIMSPDDAPGEQDAPRREEPLRDDPEPDTEEA